MKMYILITTTISMRGSQIGFKFFSSKLVKGKLITYVRSSVHKLQRIPVDHEWCRSTYNKKLEELTPGSLPQRGNVLRP